MSKITSPPDSLVISTPVNVGNAPQAAMSQDLYSASVQAAVQARGEALRKHGAVRGKPFVPEDQGDA